LQPALANAVEATNDPDLKQALTWSVAVNETVTQIVRGVPPFPFVRECLEKLYRQADILVVSATPQEALEREWAEHDLTNTSWPFAVRKPGPRRSRSRWPTLPARPHVNGRRRSGDYAAAQANKTSSSPSIPVRKKPAGSGSTRKASTAS